MINTWVKYNSAELILFAGGRLSLGDVDMAEDTGMLQILTEEWFCAAQWRFQKTFIWCRAWILPVISIKVLGFVFSLLLGVINQLFQSVVLIMCILVFWGRGYLFCVHSEYFPAEGWAGACAAVTDAVAFWYLPSAAVLVCCWSLELGWVCLLFCSTWLWQEKGGEMSEGGEAGPVKLTGRYKV